MDVRRLGAREALGRENRRPTYRRDLEMLIDEVRAVVTSMLNNPKQPSGLEPILSLRDEALTIDRPSLALVKKVLGRVTQGT